MTVCIHCSAQHVDESPRAKREMRKKYRARGQSDTVTATRGQMGGLAKGRATAKTRASGYIAKDREVLG